MIYSLKISEHLRAVRSTEQSLYFSYKATEFSRGK